MTTATTKTENNISVANNAITPLFATDYHVYINHTDAGGIVYHANHLVFFENCRRDWFTKLGLNGYFLQTDDGQVQHFVVSQIQLNYHQAIFLDEIISVRIDKVELKPASIVFYQSIHRNLSENQPIDGAKPTNTLLNSAKIVIACVQNQINPNPATLSSKNESSTSVTVASAPPIRPIRIPKILHDTIQQAVAQHTNK